MQEKTNSDSRKSERLTFNKENSREIHASKLPGHMYKSEMNSRPVMKNLSNDTSRKSNCSSFNMDLESTAHSTHYAPSGFKAAANVSMDKLNALARKRLSTEPVAKDGELASTPDESALEETDKMHPATTPLNGEIGRDSSFSKEASPSKQRIIEAAMGQAYYVAANMLPKKHGHFGFPIVPKAADPLFLPLLGLEVVTDYLTGPVNDVENRKSTNLICSECYTDVSTRWSSYKVASQVAFRCDRCQELHLAEVSRKERVHFLVDFISQAIEKIEVVSNDQGRGAADMQRRSDSTELEEQCVMEWQQKEGETDESPQNLASVDCEPIDLGEPPN